MNAVIQQRKTELASLMKDVQPLAEKSKREGLTEDESRRFDELVAALNACGDALTTAENQYQSAVAVTQKFGSLVDARSSPDGVSRDTVVDPDSRRIRLSPGQAFAESDQLKRALKSGAAKPTMRDDPVKIPGIIPLRGASGLLDALHDRTPEEIRALISSGTMSASTLLPQVYPTIYRGIEAPLVMRDVLLNLTTTSDNLTVLTEASFTNGAVEVAEATTVAGGAKPESALTFAEVSFPVRNIAHWIPITRQNLEDLAWIRGYIDGRLLTGLARREDNQILNGDGIAPNLTGILATSGTLTLDGTYFTANPVGDVGTSNENINRIRRAITRIKLASVGGAMPSFIVANPANVEEWDTATSTTREYLFAGPMTSGVSRLWGLPIVQSENIAVDLALVGDGTMAAVVDRRDAQIYTTDSHSDFFVRNLFVVLAEERIAVVVFRGSAFAEVTLA